MSGQTTDSERLASERFGLRRLSNWGRWGARDERGTANFITPAVVAQAGAEVKRGAVFFCGVMLDTDPPTHPARSGVVHTMPVINVVGADVGMQSLGIFNDDMLTMNVSSATQWDGLAHCGYQGAYYNGAKPADISAERGVTRNSVDKLIGSLITRGVLVDLVAYKGKDAQGYLDPGYAITCDDLDGCLKAENAAVRSGDALLVRTGWTAHWYAHRGQRADYFAAQPGMSIKTLEWLYDHEIACIAVDNTGVEVKPSEVAGEELPFHLIAIRDLGLTIGEVFDFTALAKDSQGDRRYTSFFVAPHQALAAASNSSPTPVAIK
ncbi:MAG: cyclase family protein [Candidatus Binataceae bacterium]